MALSRRFGSVKAVAVDSNEDDTEDDEELRLKLFGSKTRFKYSDPAKISFEPCGRDMVSSDDEDDELLDDMAPSWMEEFNQILSRCRTDIPKKRPLLFDKVLCDMNRGPLNTLRDSLENYCPHKKDMEAQPLVLSNNILNGMGNVISVTESGDPTAELTKLESRDLSVENTDIKSVISKEKKQVEIFNETNTDKLEIDADKVEIKGNDKNTNDVNNQADTLKLTDKPLLSKEKSDIQSIVSEKTNMTDNMPVSNDLCDKRLIVMKTKHKSVETNKNRVETGRKNGDDKDQCIKSQSEHHKEKNHSTEKKKPKEGNIISLGTGNRTEKPNDKKKINSQMTTDENKKSEKHNEHKKSDIQRSDLKSLSKAVGKNADAAVRKSETASLRPEHRKNHNADQNSKQQLQEVVQKTNKSVAKVLNSLLKKKGCSANISEPILLKDGKAEDAGKERRTTAEKSNTSLETKARGKTSIPSYKSEDFKKVKKYDLNPASSFPLDELLPVKKRRASEDTAKENSSVGQRKRHVTELSTPATPSSFLNSLGQSQGNDCIQHSTANENQMGNVFFGTVYDAPVLKDVVPPISAKPYQDILPSHQHATDSASVGTKEFVMSHFISTNISDIMTAINNGNTSVITSLQEALNKEIESNLQALAIGARQQSDHISSTEQCDWKPTGFYTEREDGQHIPDASGDRAQFEKQIVANQSEQLFNMFAQQCTQLVQTEEEKMKLMTLITLLKTEKGTSPIITGFTPSEIEKQSILETSIDSDSVSVMSSAPVDALFEGRTMLKGGVKPRYIPKTLVYKPGKDAPVDPRPYPRKHSVKGVVLELPPFVLEMWGKEKFDKIVGLGELPYVVSLARISSDTESKVDSKGPCYNPTKVLLSKPPNLKGTHQQTGSKHSSSKDLSRDITDKSVSLKQRYNSQNASQVSKETERSENLNNCKEHVIENKESSEVSGPLQENKSHGNSSGNDVGASCQKGTFSRKNWVPVSSKTEKPHPIPVLVSRYLPNVNSNSKSHKNTTSETAAAPHKVTTDAPRGLMKIHLISSLKTENYADIIEPDKKNQGGKKDERGQISKANCKKLAHVDMNKKSPKMPEIMGDVKRSDESRDEKPSAYGRMRSDDKIYGRMQSDDKTYGRMQSDKIDSSSQKRLDDNETVSRWSRWDEMKESRIFDGIGSTKRRGDDIDTKRRYPIDRKSYPRSDETDGKRRSGEAIGKTKSDETIGKWRFDEVVGKLRSDEIIDKKRTDKIGKDNMYYNEKELCRKKSDETFVKMISHDIEKGRSHLSEKEYIRSNETISKRKSDELIGTKRSYENKIYSSSANRNESHGILHEGKRKYKFQDMETSGWRKDENETERRYKEDSSGRRSWKQNELDSISSCSYLSDRYADGPQYQSGTDGDVFSRSRKDLASRNYRKRHSSTSSVESSTSSRTSLSSRQRHTSSKITKVTKKTRKDDTTNTDTTESDVIKERKRHHTTQESMTSYKKRRFHDTKEKRRHSQGDTENLRKAVGSGVDKEQVTNNLGTLHMVYHCDTNTRGIGSTDLGVLNRSCSSSKVSAYTTQEKGDYRERQKETLVYKSGRVSKTYQAGACQGKEKEIPKKYQDKPSVVPLREEISSHGTKASASMEEDKLFLDNYRKRLSGEKMEKNGNVVARTVSAKDKAQENEDRLFLLSIKKRILERSEKIKSEGLQGNS